jgi:TonB family protein
MFESDPARPALSAAETQSEGGTVSPGAETVEELDLRVLAAKFSAHSGGRVSPELSADLALDVVLNEIVEQACLATGASGAAIVLERGGEWICRATAGNTAPDLGSRLNTDAGLSGACLGTWTVQRCDDAQSDARADIEACRNLGVRSVIILPLLQNERLAGVFELFSSSPSAFGESDERTLEALSRRVIENLARASEPLVDPVVDTVKPVEHPRAGRFVTDYILAENMDPTSNGDRGTLDPLVPEPASEATSGRGLNILTWVLGAAVLAIALLLVVRVGQRLLGGTGKAHAHPPSVNAAPLADTENQPTAASSVTSGNQSAESKPSSTPPSSSANLAPTSGAVGATDSAPPAGSLLVYENGKEVFRVPPSGVPDTSAEDGILNRVEPEYPEEARQQGIQGPVVIDLDIGVDGKVREAKAVSGPPVLAQAVMDAVKQWVFKPHRVNGQLVPMQRRITLHFKLPH